MQALLAAGAEVNAKDDGGLTVFIWAANQGHTDIVQTLLDRGADVNAKDDHGGTALTRAAGFGHTHTVEILLAPRCRCECQG